MKAEGHHSPKGQSNRYWRKKTLSMGTPATAFRTLVGDVLFCPLLSLRIFHKKLLFHTNIFFKAQESRDLFSHRSFLVNILHKVELDSQTLESLVFNGPFSVTFHLWRLGSSSVGFSGDNLEV